MSLKILFVDDDQNLLESISRTLTVERDDISFATAHSAEEALEMLKSDIYNVIVTDHKMPGMDGLTLLSLIRSEYPHLKRVMLSAQVHEHIFKEAESLAELYISKPCDTGSIIDKIEKLFR
jgi:CheY-like chemotaxis protein